MYNSTEEIFETISEKQNDINHYNSIMNHNYDEIDKFVSDQAKLRIKYKSKFTNLIENKFVIFPPNINCEQSSSEATASYKSQIIKELNFDYTNNNTNNSQSKNIKILVDGTCGFGTDSIAFANICDKVIGLDIDKNIIEINNYNISINNNKNLSFENIDFEKYLDTLINDNTKIDLIYLDPSRRDSNGKKVFLIDELTPNIFTILDKLKITTRYLMIKFSPLIDITYLINSFDKIIQIDIIEYEKELKEILITVDFELDVELHEKLELENDKTTNSPKVNLVSIKDINDYKVNSYILSPKESKIKLDAKTFANIDKFQYLYEPSPSEMKFANWDIFSDFSKISNNTHLFLLKEESALNYNYLGKYYKILEIGAINNKILKKLNINKANIKVRNSTVKVDDLYKKLKIKTGGEYYIFAFGNDNYKNKMIVSKKVED